MDECAIVAYNLLQQDVRIRYEVSIVSVVCENITENRFECATNDGAIARFWWYSKLFFWASSFFVVFIDHLQLLFNWNLYEIVMYLSRTWQLESSTYMWCWWLWVRCDRFFYNNKCFLFGTYIRYDEDVKHASMMWHRRIYYYQRTAKCIYDDILKSQPSTGRVWMSEVIFQNKKSILIKVESSHITKGLTESGKKLITVFFRTV